MAPQTTKKSSRPLLPGILALATALVLMLGLLISLNSTRPEPTEPETTAGPTFAPNPYGPEDFTYDDRGYLTCTKADAVLGIDVSEHQQDIDWAQVKDAGIEYVMIRVGWRGHTLGALAEDSMAQTYYAGAKAAGLKVGAYFFSQAVTEQEAVAEAEFAMNVIRDWALDLPLVCDWEFVDSTCRTGNMDARSVTDCVKAFCETVRLGGYQPMVYFNLYHARELLYLEELTDYPFWLAMYDSEMDYPYAVDQWQYTSTGTVPGIPGDVDLNLWFPAV